MIFKMWMLYGIVVAFCLSVMPWAHLQFIPLWLFYPICSSLALIILSYLQFIPLWVFCPICSLSRSGYFVLFAVYPAPGILSYLQFIPLWVFCPIYSLSRSGYLVPFAVLPPWVFCPMYSFPLWVSCPICSLFRFGYLVPFAVYPALGIWFPFQFTVCIWSYCKLILVYLVPPKMYPSLGILTHWELIPWQKIDHYSLKEIRDSLSRFLTLMACPQN